jgi:hypothetical protein
LLTVFPRSGERQVVRIEPGKKQRVLMNLRANEPLLSDNGKTFAVVTRYSRRSPIQIRSARDGSLLRKRGGFRISTQAVALRGGRLLVSSFELGTSIWNWRKDTVRDLTDSFVYRADFGTNRMAFFTGDPTTDGCTVVTTIADPGTELWRSCTESVRDFSPDGKRMVTGPPPAETNDLPEIAWERTVDGDELATYTASRELGVLGWETSTDLLLDAYSKKRGATVRCSEGICERASDLRPTPRF